MSESEADRRLALSDADAAAYRARREALHAAVADLDEVLDELEAQPVPDPARFRAALGELRAKLDRHIVEADAPGGLLAQILEAAVWFGSRAERLRGEHGDLLARTDGLIDRATTASDVRPLLSDARDLSSRVATHRHRGTKLLQDAYMLDVAAGD